MKDRLAEVVDEVVITGQNADEKMCSCESNVVDETCSSESYDACRDGGIDGTERHIKPRRVPLFRSKLWQPRQYYFS